MQKVLQLKEYISQIDWHVQKMNFNDFKHPYASGEIGDNGVQMLIRNTFLYSIE